MKKNKIWKLETLQLTDEEIDEVVRYFQNKRKKREKHEFVGPFGELEWTDEEYENLKERIINLRDDQIGALAYIAVEFKRGDIDKIVEGIKKLRILEKGSDDIDLDVIITEFESKEGLLWWLDYFERHNKNENI